MIFMRGKSLKTVLLLYFITGALFYAQAQLLPGFHSTGIFNEQELTIKNHWENVVVNINAPVQFHPNGKTWLIFYALPNGNNIEWTKGKRVKEGDDWHFNIQHIAAQTRYIRNLDRKNTYIVVYMMSEQKSWPTWKRTTANSINLIKSIIDSTASLFETSHPKLVLNGHSGGGSLIFGYLDAVDNIPSNIERIAFLDSAYGYDEGLHKDKLIKWLNLNNQNKLVVLAYNDSVVIYNGNHLVSPTGGTWFRSRLMQRNLSSLYKFTTVSDTAFIRHAALNGRIDFILKENPHGLIYHTTQVEKNGFILSLLSGTKYDKRKYFTYFGGRSYEKYISDSCAVIITPN